MLSIQTQFCVRLVLGCLAGIVLAGPLQAATITINFDVDADGDPIPSGTVINSTYSRFGVALSCVGGVSSDGCSGTNVYATNNRDNFGTLPNAVSTQPDSSFASFNNSTTRVLGVLDRNAVEICVLVDPEGSVDFAILEIVNAVGTQLDAVTSTPGVQETLCIQGVGISYFRFAGDGRFASFDDLRITYGPNRVDFDTTADGSDIANGTAVDTLFVSEGVTFERVGSGSCGQDFVYANDDLPGSFGSPPNAVSVCSGNLSDFSENTNGSVRARFPRRVNTVCIDVLPTSASDQAVLRGFDKDDVQVAETISAAGVSGRICVNNSFMRSVEFGGYQGRFARFDNLDFTFGAAAIDFDVDTNDDPVPANSVINDTYTSAGVNFESERIPLRCGTGDEVYANDDTTGDFSSSPNQVSLCNTNFSDFSESNDGMVHATFALDALSACIEVRATKADDYAVLRAYNASDVLLGEVTSQAGATETLCISGDAIRGVRFAGDGNRFARFDDLDVVFSPEPGSVVLGAASLLALAALSRRGRRRARPTPQARPPR